MKLVFTNGDSAGARIEKLGLGYQVEPWRDVLHEGPLRANLPLAKRSEERAHFIAKWCGEKFPDVQQGFKDRDKLLFNLIEYERVELWFEHDLYDQLQLAQILDFAHHNLASQEFFLVQSDDYLGEISDEVFKALPNMAKPVSSDMKTYAAGAWAAITNDTPELLCRIFDHQDLPFIAPSIRRLIMEYPDVKHGLPTSIYNAMMLLIDGPDTIGRLFHHMQNCELTKFMGDTSFANHLDELGTCAQPLIAGENAIYSTSDVMRRINNDGNADDLEGRRSFFQQKIHLTEYGQKVMGKTENHVLRNGIDRWICGVHLTPENLYFYDTSRAKLVRGDQCA